MIASRAAYQHFNESSQFYFGFFYYFSSTRGIGIA